VQNHGARSILGAYRAVSSTNIIVKNIALKTYKGKCLIIICSYQ
jgi:hypothetical protein